MSLQDEVTRCFDALNRGDPGAFLELYDPEIELFVAAWSSPDNGVFRGADAVNRWYADNFAHWSGQHWDVIEAFESGPTVAFVLQWAGRGKRSGLDIEGRIFMVMSFLEGRIATIVQLGTFGEGVVAH
jgi:ketosteroid isomerase-like protein